MLYVNLLNTDYKCKLLVFIFTLVTIHNIVLHMYISQNPRSVSALTSTPKTKVLGDWVVMSEFGDASGSVPCPFRTFRSPGEYEPTYIVKCRHSVIYHNVI